MRAVDVAFRALAPVLAAAAAGTAFAQEPRPSITVPASVQPRDVEAATPRRQVPPTVVDSGTADRNSLSTSLRVMPVDLSPHGFERVYAVPGRDDLLMRSDGALFAVFSQSVYGRDPRRGTTRALIPAATVFFIGRPDFSSIRSSGIRDVDLASRPAARADTSGPAPSMQGVRRIDAKPIDAKVDPSEHRIDGTTDGRVRAPAAPAEDPPVDVVHGPPRPASVPAAVDAAAPSESRESRPGFQERIDELMGRAKRPK